MRIRCLTTRPFLRRYVDSEVGARLTERVQVHLDRCTACRERAQTLMLELPLIRPADIPAVSSEEWEELWSSITARVEADDEVRPGADRPPFSHRRSHLALIAAAVALLVAGAVIRLALMGSAGDQTPIASYIQYHEAAVDGHVLLENHFSSAQVLPVSYTTGN